MDRPDCACRGGLFLRGRNAQGPDYWQEGDVHHRDGRDLRRPDADGLVQFRRAVSAVGVRLSRRDECEISHGRRNRGSEPRARSRCVSCSPSSGRRGPRTNSRGGCRMKMAAIIARYLMGLIFTVFGLNGFLNFIPQPPPPNPLMVQFLTSVSQSHFAAFFFAIQLLGGLLLLSGYFVPLALTLLAAALYNILAFHLTLAPATIAPALVTSVLWVLVFLQYRNSFTDVLAAEPAVQG